MTEIPEHLLKRSQSARAKASGDAAPAADSAPSTAVEAAAPAAPAAAKAATPAKAAVPDKPVVKPDPPYVAAAKQRKKIPFWAMATLTMLPLWTLMYVRGLTPTEEVVEGPLGVGAEIYAANCSSCHGGNGEGGVGYAFAGGEVLKSYPHIEDMLAFVYLGTVNYANAGIQVPGNPEREGGPHVTGALGQMPAQGPTAGGALTEYQILAVVCHERFTLGGADPSGEYAEEYEKWCSPEAPAWTGLQGGEFSFDTIADALEGTLVVGTEPRPGSAPGAMP